MRQWKGNQKDEEDEQQQDEGFVDKRAKEATPMIA